MKRITIIVVMLASVALAGGDQANPHRLTTIAGRAAWISGQNELDRETARHDAVVKHAKIRWIVDLHKARSLAARAENADEIVRIDAAIDHVKSNALGVDLSSLDGDWDFTWGTTGTRRNMSIRAGVIRFSTDTLNRPLQMINGRVLMLEQKSPERLEIIYSADRLVILGWTVADKLDPMKDSPNHVGIAVRR